MCLFPFIIFLQDLPAEVGKKLPGVGKSRNLVEAFRSTASSAAYPGKALILA